MGRYRMCKHWCLRCAITNLCKKIAGIKDV